MSSILARFLRDTVQHQPRTGSTPKGTPQYGAVRQVKCSQSSGDKVTLDSANGEQFTPQLVVWTYDLSIKHGDKLGGYTVRRIEKSTELRGPQSVKYYAG